MNRNHIYLYISPDSTEGQRKCGTCGNLDVADLRVHDWDSKKFHEYTLKINGETNIGLKCGKCGNYVTEPTIVDNPVI